MAARSRISRRRAADIVRLAHPFPSTLDAVATSALVVIAGGDTATAVRLGLAMLALQASIGSFNDWRDAAIDRRTKPGKPLASGTVPGRIAAGVAVVCALVGMALVVPSGSVLVILALAGLAIGYAYDLALSRTALSWLPWAMGIPLLVVFAWYGAVQALPRAFVLLLPLAAVAGTALAIGNALADIERDGEAGVRTIAVALGRMRAWRVAAALHVAVLSAAAVSLLLPVPIGSSSDAGRITGFAGLLGGGALVGLGLGLARRGSASARELGWEAQALGVGLVAVGWLVGIGAV